MLSGGLLKLLPMSVHFLLISFYNLETGPFLKKDYLLLFYVYELLPVYMYVHHLYVCCPRWPKDSNDPL